MNTVHILLVEDNDGDILLTREAFEDARLPNRLSVVRDGKEAMDFLNKEGKYQDEVIPDIVLLDINLPKRNGHQVLQFIKGEDNFKHMPVIMLTTSSSERDINLSYQHYANCYITKPVEANDFLSVISRIEDFWISTVHLPILKTEAGDKR